MTGHSVEETEGLDDKMNFQEILQTPVANQVINSSFATCFYLSILLISIVSVYNKSLMKLCTSSNLIFMSFLGFLFVPLATLVNSEEASIEVRQIFRIGTGIIVGILYLIWGTWKLFEKPPAETGQRHLLQALPMLGNIYPSMGLVIACITFPLIVIEIIILMGSRIHHESNTNSTTAGNDTTRVVERFISGHLSEITIHNLHMGLRGVYLVQKILQGMAYSLLRSSVAMTEYKEQAVYFFRVLAFFNFALWLDCITYVEIDAEMDNLSNSYGGASGIIEVIYDALLIDYRLLCSLLFLEHSFHMVVKASQTGYDLMIKSRYVPTPYISLEEKRLRNLGICCGLVCLLFEIIMCLHYKKELNIGPEIHLLSISVSLFLIACGFMILRANNVNEDHTEWHAVDSMVCCMGCTGFTCWLVKGSLSAYWASCYENEELSYYMNWASAKLFIRAILVLFLIYLFNKVKVDTIVVRNRNVRWNYFFVSMMIFGMFAIFFGNAVDQYTGIVDREFTKNAVFLHESIILLFHIGPPFHLGFCIHLFLHFLLMQRKMGLEWAKIDDGGGNNGDTPLLDEPFEHAMRCDDFDVPEVVESDPQEVHTSSEEANEETRINEKG